MQIVITTKQILRVLYVLSWILFIAMCVEAGSFVFNAVYTMTINANAADYFQLGDLYNRDKGNYLVIILFMFIAGAMKALIFFLMVKIMKDKKFIPSAPFNNSMTRFLFLFSYLAFGIGLFSHWGMKYSSWLKSQGIIMPGVETLRIDGAGVWLFMAITLFIIAQLFKRGIEIQTENELTI